MFFEHINISQDSSVCNFVIPQVLCHCSCRMTKIYLHICGWVSKILGRPMQRVGVLDKFHHLPGEENCQEVNCLSFFMWWLGHGGWQVKTRFSSKAGYNWEESIEVISVYAGHVTAPLLPTARFYSLPCNSFISSVIGKFNSCSNLF